MPRAELLHWSRVLLAAWAGLCIALGVLALWSGGRSSPSASKFDVYERLPPVILDKPAIFRHTFRVVNRSKQRVRILRIRSTCNCTEQRLGARELKAAEATTLRLAAQLPPRLGWRTLSCTLSTDCKEQAEWRYTCAVQVFPRVRVEPERVYLGQLEPGEHREAQFRLESYSLPEEHTLRFAGTRANLVAIRPLGPVQRASVDGHVVRSAVRLAASMALSEMAACGQEKVELYVHRGDEVYDTAVTVSWDVRAPVEVVPRSGAFFGRVEASDQSPVRFVRIRSTDGVAFRVKQVSCSEPCVRASVDSDQPSCEHVVTLRLDGTRLRSVMVGTVEALLDHPSQARVTIPWAASCVAGTPSNAKR